MSYDGDAQSLDNPYTDGIAEFADEISSLHDSIIMAFETSSITDIITNFIKKLYIDDIESYYSDISSYLTSLFVLDDIQKLQEKYTEIRTVDDSITSFVKISADVSSSNEMMTFENYDKFLIKELKVPQNKIYIVDKTRGKYEKDTFGNEVIGIMPVIVTPTNAMFYQELIRKNDALLNDYNVIAKVRNSYRTEQLTKPYSTSLIPFDQDNLTVDNYDGESRQFVGLGEYLGLESNATVNDYSVSQAAAEQFPLIKFLDGRLDREHLNKIGVVVFKLFRDSSNENRISFSPVESFVGSLDREARDETTNAKMFIDDIVNTNSDYISIFSNANIPKGQDASPTGIKNADTFVICNQTACSMGFYERDTVKYIHVTNSIYNPILKIFEKYEDKNMLDIDLIIDGGVSNIAQFIASTCKINPKTQAIVNEPFSRFGLYDLDSPTAYLYNSLDTHSQVNVWKKVLQRYDEFVKNTRKDCLFIADGPRPFCLEGNSKIVRPSKPKNTIKNSILPKLKYVSNVVNSSYSTGYLDWFWSLDHSTGDYIWMPPSIKAVGVYIYTDTYGAFWDAPAGVNRGHVLDTLDVAFNPTNDEAGQIYINSWNYAMSYPLDGIVLEGQKTFQRNKTALDRVNVRRLMLGMEKTLRSMLKYFNYEGNTEFLRSRIKDAADNYLNQVRANDGISEYIVVCDERNNTPENIDNNELHVAIAIKPIKSIEFIILGFLCTNQSVDVEEALQSELNNM